MTSGTLLSSCLVVGIGREWQGAAVRTLRSMVTGSGPPPSFSDFTASAGHDGPNVVLDDWC